MDEEGDDSNVESGIDIHDYKWLEKMRGRAIARVLFGIDKFTEEDYQREARELGKEITSKKMNVDDQEPSR